MTDQETRRLAEPGCASPDAVLSNTITTFMRGDRQDRLTADAIETRLRDVMAGYASDPAKGDMLLQVACAQASDPLPLYRVLYKFYNRLRRFEVAGDYAARALSEAARQGGLPQDYADWTREHIAGLKPHLASQVLLALKATAFIALRSGDESGARPCLAKLAELDPEDGSGVSVVMSLADGA